MTNTNIVPIEDKRGLYKKPVARLALDAWVAKMILSGYRQTDLLALYENEFGKTITQSTVSKTVTKLKKEWLLSRREDTEFYINRELERLDVAENIAWNHYRTCGGTVQDTEVKDLFGADGSIKESLTTVKTKEDPRLAMQWFDRILRIQTDRRKVLRLESVVNIQNIMAIKGYAHFNPGSDWPEPPNLPKANVIDAEFAEKGKEQ